MLNPDPSTLTLGTPALLFPAISLLLLAYTNRFVTLANLIRNLHDKYKLDPNAILKGQIANLRYRVELIKHMQASGISSLLFCVLCMFLLFAGWIEAAKWIFGFSLLLMISSLGLSLVEIWISVRAINLHLSDLRDREAQRPQ